MAEKMEDCSMADGSSTSVSPDPLTPKVLKELDSNVELDSSTPKMKVVQCYEVRNGWCHTRKRVPLKSKKKAVTSKIQHQHRRTPNYSENYKRSIQHLYHKEKRFTCPDCEAWYAGDKRKIQLTCRHRQRYETEEELKMWNIGFDSDYDDDD